MITLGRVRLSWGPNGPKGQSVSFPPPVNRGIVLWSCILGTPPSIQAGRYVGLRPYNFPDGGTIFQFLEILQYFHISIATVCTYGGSEEIVLKMQRNPEGGERDQTWPVTFAGCQVRRKLLLCIFSLRMRVVAFGSPLSASCQHHSILSILYLHFILCIFVSFYIDPANWRGTLLQLVQIHETAKVLLPASIPCFQKQMIEPALTQTTSCHTTIRLMSQRQQTYTNQSSDPGAPELGALAWAPFS